MFLDFVLILQHHFYVLGGLFNKFLLFLSKNNKNRQTIPQPTNIGSTEGLSCFICSVKHTTYSKPTTSVRCLHLLLVKCLSIYKLNMVAANTLFLIRWNWLPLMCSNIWIAVLLSFLCSTEQQDWYSQKPGVGTGRRHDTQLLYKLMLSQKIWWPQLSLVSVHQ